MMMLLLLFVRTSLWTLAAGIPGTRVSESVTSAPKQKDEIATQARLLVPEPTAICGYK